MNDFAMSTRAQGIMHSIEQQEQYIKMLESGLQRADEDNARLLSTLTELYSQQQTNINECSPVATPTPRRRQEASWLPAATNIEHGAVEDNARLQSALTELYTQRQTPVKECLPVATPMTLRRREEASWLPANTKIEHREHTFTCKSTIRREYCDVCAKGITFGSKHRRCVDCKFTCHGDCRDRAPLPCIPRDHLPASIVDKQHIKLFDIVPTSRPMIPYIIIHLCLHLEQRRLPHNQAQRIQGQYTHPPVAGSMSGTFYSILRSRALPAFDNWRLEQLTGCVLQTLHLCTSPLLPRTSWHEFVHTVGQGDQRRLMELVLDLPIAPRDTLAYLMAHWLLVCLLPDMALCESLAPLVIGNESDHTTEDDGPDDVRKRNASLVMFSLFKIPREFWLGCFDVHCSNQDIMQMTQHPSNATDLSSILSPTQQSLTHTLLTNEADSLVHRTWFPDAPTPISPPTLYHRY